MRNLATIMLCLLFTGTVFADEIKIEGGGTCISTVFMPIKNGFEKYNGHTLNIVQSSAIKGLIALNEGKVDIAAGAHPLEDLIAGAAKNGVVIDGSTLVATQIEENRLVVIVNRSNPVRTLSKAHLRDIFTGRITNWTKVGGPDLPIDVVWGKETQGQNIQFSRVVLTGEPVTTKVREATTYRNISQLVSEVPGAIGIVPSHMNTPTTHTLDTFKIVSPMYAITRGAPSEKVQQVLEYYKKEYDFLN